MGARRAGRLTARNVPARALVGGELPRLLRRALPPSLPRQLFCSLQCSPLPRLTWQRVVGCMAGNAWRPAAPTVRRGVRTHSSSLPTPLSGRRAPKPPLRGPLPAPLLRAFAQAAVHARLAAPLNRAACRAEAGRDDVLLAAEAGRDDVM
jgi:hypothetical protein